MASVARSSRPSDSGAKPSASASASRWTASDFSRPSSVRSGSWSSKRSFPTCVAISGLSASTSSQYHRRGCARVLWAYPSCDRLFLFAGNTILPAAVPCEPGTAAKDGAGIAKSVARGGAIAQAGSWLLLVTEPLPVPIGASEGKDGHRDSGTHKAEVVCNESVDGKHAPNNAVSSRIEDHTPLYCRLVAWELAPGAPEPIVRTGCGNKPHWTAE
jgi:hypothetical protein